MPKEKSDSEKCCCNGGCGTWCGVFLALFGLLLLLGNYGYLSAGVWKLWPLLLVLIGAWMAYRGSR